MTSAILGFGPPVFLSLVLRAMTAESVAGLDANSTSESKEWRLFAPVSIITLSLRSLDNAAFRNGRPLQPNDAYFFAIAAAACQLIKSQCDLQRLYFSRRASVRIKGELVASIYEKALKRKYMSGVVEKQDSRGKGNARPERIKPGEVSNADIGKIVSLVAADAEWVSRFVTLGSVSGWLGEFR